MENQVEISTQRLILKSITPSIIHEMYATKTKEEIIQFFGFSEDGYEHYRNMHEKGMETYQLSLFFFLLIHKETDQPIGECGFHTWNKKHKRAELFYNIMDESYKQNGYMTEALKAVLDFGYTKLSLHRIEALVANSNIPSVKLLLRNNFTKEGIMREDYNINGKNEDSVCYSLLKWEWESKI